jgi:hypothetical protein
VSREVYRKRCFNAIHDLTSSDGDERRVNIIRK